MKRMKLFTLFIGLLLVFVLVACAAPAPAPSPTPAPAPKPSPAPAPAPSPTAALPEKISFASHAVGSMHHAVVTALSKVASEKSPILVVVTPTTGPPAWVPGMASTGKPELGSAHNMDAWWAYNGKVSPVSIPDDMLGTKPFYQANPNLRVLAAPARAATGMLVKADSPFKTFQDLKTKKARIASGYIGQPSAFISMIVDLLNQGLTLSDFTEVKVASPVEAVKALQEGRVDATNAAVGMGAVVEADAAVGVRFLPTSTKPEDVKRATRIFPGGNFEVWEPGPAGVKERMPLWTYPIDIVTSTSLPDQVAEVLLEAWWNNYKELQKLHVAFERITSPNMFVLEQISIPYHEGAVKFYKKKGVWSAKMDTIQQRLLKGEFPFLD